MASGPRNGQGAARPNLVNLEQAAKSYGTTVVLDRVSLGIAEGERVGVVGRNGGGKSTLLRLLAGDEAPDSGRVTQVSGLRVTRVDQQGELEPAATVRALVVGTAAEFEWAGDAAVREVLAGLGLLGLGLDSPVARLSGGERRRVALAAALVQAADLIVLDEPTNHLDIEGITWLAGHLQSRRGALLVVTHDRWFLDAVCERMWEVGDGDVRAFEGGYASYVLARAERARLAGAAEARRQNLLRKELAWLRRGPPARTSKPRFRIDAAEALIADEPTPRQSVQLQALARRRLGKTVVELEDVSLQVAERVLLDHVNWQLAPGARVGVVGVNGSGKTHLLRLLAGEVAPSSGEVLTGQTVRLAHLSQHVGELPDGLRVVEAVTEVRPAAHVGGVELTAGQLTERFGFAAERQWTPVGDLSGGERRRLQLLRLLLTEPNVLLLDEPTNDLDTDTLTALEDLLDDWAGAVVVVSHDRYLLQRVCDTTVALLGDGALPELPGGVEEYLRRRTTAQAVARADQGERRDRRGDTRAARKELDRLERRVAALTTREAGLHEQLVGCAADDPSDYVTAAELDAQLRALVTERTAAEDEWLRLAESLE